MKHFLKYFLLAPVIVTIFASCYYDSEEYLYGKPGGEGCPDSTVFTYSAGVQPILNKNCYSCHSNAAAASMGGGIKLQDYQDVQAQAANGKLLGSITHAPGFSPMPKGGRKLAECNIQIIRKWVNAGMQNN